MKSEAVSLTSYWRTNVGPSPSGCLYPPVRAYYPLHLFPNISPHRSLIFIIYTVFFFLSSSFFRLSSLLTALHVLIYGGPTKKTEGKKEKKKKDHRSPYKQDVDDVSWQQWFGLMVECCGAHFLRRPNTCARTEQRVRPPQPVMEEWLQLHILTMEAFNG